MNIETPRLLLRPFTLDDVPHLARISADPEVMLYIGGGVQSYETIEKRVRSFIEYYEKNGYSLFALIYKENNNFIGFCGLIEQTVDNHKYIELGYRLDKDYWNLKIATEAAMHTKDFVFNKIKLPEIISIIQPANIASRCVAKKIGMQIYKETLFHDTPVVIYHMLNPHSAC